MENQPKINTGKLFQFADRLDNIIISFNQKLSCACEKKLTFGDVIWTLDAMLAVRKNKRYEGLVCFKLMDAFDAEITLLESKDFFESSDELILFLENCRYKNMQVFNIVGRRYKRLGLGILELSDTEWSYMSWFDMSDKSDLYEMGY